MIQLLLESLIDKVAQTAKKTIAVAVAEDEELIDAVADALNRNLGNFILFGDQKKIETIVALKHLNGNPNIKIIHADSKAQAAEFAVKAIYNKEANVLMKGNIQQIFF